MWEVNKYSISIVGVHTRNIVIERILNRIRILSSMNIGLPNYTPLALPRKLLFRTREFTLLGPCTQTTVNNNSIEVHHQHRAGIYGHAMFTNAQGYSINRESVGVYFWLEPVKLMQSSYALYQELHSTAYPVLSGKDKRKSEYIRMGLEINTWVE